MSNIIERTRTTNHKIYLEVQVSFIKLKLNNYKVYVINIYVFFLIFIFAFNTQSYQGTKNH